MVHTILSCDKYMVQSITHGTTLLSSTVHPVHTVFDDKMLLLSWQGRALNQRSLVISSTLHDPIKGQLHEISQNRYFSSYHLTPINES